MRTRLKGGSLSATYMMQDVSLYNNKLFVRKEVSLKENREYGFQRWYSQLKRLQRYSIIFPGLFPSVLKYGSNDEFAYFDIEFIENAVNAYDYLANEKDSTQIDLFFDELKNRMNILHSVELDSCSDAMNLYIHEEVTQRIKDALNNTEFAQFIEYDTVKFNNELVTSFYSSSESYISMMNSTYTNNKETLSHGNLTLENILYIPTTNTIVFIDPYEENIIDSKLADYSQLLQSCNSKYEMLNASLPTVVNNEVATIDCKNYGLDYFNDLLHGFLSQSLSDNDYKSVRLLEISQFIRMLPFKSEVDPSKMILFYSLASKLFNDIR